MTTALYFNVAGKTNSFIVKEEWDEIPGVIRNRVSLAFKPNIPKEFVCKDRWGLAGDHKTPFGTDSLRHVDEWLASVMFP